MEYNENTGFLAYRPGNLIRKDGMPIIAWPGDLCIPESLAKVTPLEIDELVLKHLGFEFAGNPVLVNQTFRRKIKWPVNTEEDRKQLEFFVHLKDDCVLMGLKHPKDPGTPREMIEVRFAHDLQNHYAAITGVDELNVLSKNR